MGDETDEKTASRCCGCAGSGCPFQNFGSSFSRAEVARAIAQLDSTESVRNHLLTQSAWNCQRCTELICGCNIWTRCFGPHNPESICWTAGTLLLVLVVIAAFAGWSL